MSDAGRDALLAYATQLLDSLRQAGRPGLTSIPIFDPVRESSDQRQDFEQILPLLNLLRAVHPHHLPTLLLLGSVQYEAGDLMASLATNQEILSLEPTYVRLVLSQKISP